MSIEIFEEKVKKFRPIFGDELSINIGKKLVEYRRMEARVKSEEALADLELKADHLVFLLEKYEKNNKRTNPNKDVGKGDRERSTGSGEEPGQSALCD